MTGVSRFEMNDWGREEKVEGGNRRMNLTKE